MKYVLIVTSSEDNTSELVEKELISSGADFIRLNTETYGSDFQIDCKASKNSFDSKLITIDKSIDLQEVFSIWNRRPLKPIPSFHIENHEAAIFSSEELKSSLYGNLFALNCTWVNHPSHNRFASHKVYQLKLAQSCGFLIPKTIVTMNPEKVRDFYYSLKIEGKDVICKLISKGPPRAETPEKQYCIYSSIINEEDIRNDFSLSLCPAIYQEYIEKEFELRITVVGSEVFSCKIESQKSEKTKIDWRRYDISNTPHSSYLLSSEVELKCLQITKKLGLFFSTIDLIVTPANQTIFLELNPNGQWGWIEELTKLPISKSLAKLLTN